MAAAMLGISAAITLALGYIAFTNSDFFADDMLSLFELRRDGVGRFLQSPVNVQWVPLHRLATWAIDRAFGHRFGAALSVSLLFHVAGLAMLYRVVRRLTKAQRSASGRDRDGLAERVAPAMLVLLYATHLFVGIQLLWWSSGLHRLPYALATLVAMDRWLEFRETTRKRDAVWVAFATLVAAGFYAKGPLVVPHVLALEACLIRHTPSERRLTHLKAAAALMAWAGLVGWLGLSLSGQTSFVQANLSLIAQIEWEALKVLLAGFVGQAAGLYVPLASRAGFLVVAILGIAAGVASVRQRREHVWSWVLIGVAITANTAVLALSNRGAVWGVMLAHGHRYYLDHLVVLIPLLALVLPDALGRSSSTPRRWIVCAAIVMFASASNVAGLHGLLRSRYAPFVQTHAFFERFGDELARVRATVPRPERVFQNGRMPRPLLGIAPQYNSWSHMAMAMNLDLQFSPRGKWLIEPDGSIVRKAANGSPKQPR